MDQRGSSTGADHVEHLLLSLRTVPMVRIFERTAGDEVQGVLDDPVAVIDTTLALVHLGAWSVGIGIGPVELPLPASTRAGRGPAFQHARNAVERAKSSVTHLAVRGAGAPGIDDGGAADVEAVLDLLAVQQHRRSAEGWEAVTMMVAGMSQTAAAARLDVSKQAVSQRLRAAGWAQDRAGRRTAARLLSRVDR